MERRDRGVAQSLGGPLARKVKESRVLLIGAGGIGCELLKNLVCCGFGSGYVAPIGQNGASTPSDTEVKHARKAEIVVVDLDTIDLSNLNRQFLFRTQHIKKPKALVAKETANQFNPSVSIDAHHASIYDSPYDVEFFEGFDVVFNALDNLAARRHVNRMCLAAKVPLIESGTTGFNGNVQAIQKGVTECYDCHDKPIQKSYPICTIRSTPSQPIHCIVWAKSYLLPELFGTSEEDSSDVAVTEGDNAEEVATLKEEAEALKKIRLSIGKKTFAQEVFNKVFHDDIKRLRSVDEMWRSRTAPESLRFETLSIDKDPVEQGRNIAVQDQSTWSIHDNLKVFCYSIDTLSRRVGSGEKVIEFDKDDKDTLDLVASAANLRSHIFGIPLNSEWEIKQMAGNIIPAIATSNALTASLCVMQAFKILRSQMQAANGTTRQPVNGGITAGGRADGSKLLGGSKMIFLESKHTESLIRAGWLAPPRPDCPVCSPTYAKLIIQGGGSPTLQQLVDLLRARFGYDEFSITAEIGVIYDPDLEDNLGKPLAELRIDGKDNNFITITDDSDTPKVDLLLSATSSPTTEDHLRILPDDVELPLKPEKKQEVTNDDAEDAVVMDAVPTEASIATKKRKREAEEEVESAQVKKAKGLGEAEVIDDDGVILLDD